MDALNAMLRHPDGVHTARDGSGVVKQVVDVLMSDCSAPALDDDAVFAITVQNQMPSERMVQPLRRYYQWMDSSGYLGQMSKIAADPFITIPIPQDVWDTPNGVMDEPIANAFGPTPLLLGMALARHDGNADLYVQLFSTALSAAQVETRQMQVMSILTGRIDRARACAFVLNDMLGNRVDPSMSTQLLDVLQDHGEWGSLSGAVRFEQIAVLGSALRQRELGYVPCDEQEWQDALDQLDSCYARWAGFVNRPMSEWHAAEDPWKSLSIDECSIRHLAGMDLQKGV